MKRLTFRLFTAVPAVVFSAAAASAQTVSSRGSWWGSWTFGRGGASRSSVPEIDASTGALAIAAIAAAILLTREIKRRRS